MAFGNVRDILAAELQIAEADGYPIKRAALQKRGPDGAAVKTLNPLRAIATDLYGVEPTIRLIGADLGLDHPNVDDYILYEGLQYLITDVQTDSQSAVHTCRCAPRGRAGAQT